MPAGAKTQRWAPQTRYTLRRNTASILKDLIWSPTLQIKKFFHACISKLACLACSHEAMGKEKKIIKEEIADKNPVIILDYEAEVAEDE